MSNKHDMLARIHPADEPTQDQAAFFRDLAAQLTRLADEVAPSSGPPEDAIDRAGKDSLLLAAFAEALIKSRRRRSHWIASSLLGEPAWDLLLQLFANSVLGRRQTVLDLALALNVDQPVVIRWGQALLERGLVSFNSRLNQIGCIELVASSRAAMADMLNEWRQLGQLFGRG